MPCRQWPVNRPTVLCTVREIPGFEHDAHTPVCGVRPERAANEIRLILQ